MLSDQNCLILLYNTRVCNMTFVLILFIKCCVSISRQFTEHSRITHRRELFIERNILTCKINRTIERLKVSRL